MRSVGEHSCEVLIIDDGSVDETGAIADRLAGSWSHIGVIHHRINLGLGASFREAVQQATGEKFLIVPGDNDLTSETLQLLLKNSRVAELVMCFFLNREERGRWRNAISDLFRLLYAIVFDLHVQYLNGPAVYPTASLRKLPLKSDRFSIVAEVNVKLLRQGLTYVEIPGYMQTGIAGSTALSFRAFREVISVFLRLIWDVHVTGRMHFNRRPRRVEKGIALLSDAIETPHARTVETR